MAATPPIERNRFNSVCIQALTRFLSFSRKNWNVFPTSERATYGCRTFRLRPSSFLAANNNKTRTVQPPTIFVIPGDISGKLGTIRRPWLPRHFINVRRFGRFSVPNIRRSVHGARVSAVANARFVVKLTDSIYTRGVHQRALRTRRYNW